jgi:hypothetical protein
VNICRKGFPLPQFKETMDMIKTRGIPLSKIRACDNCDGPIAPTFYVIEINFAAFDQKNVNAVLGLNQYFGGEALKLAETMAPGADEAIQVCDDSGTRGRAVHLQQNVISTPRSRSIFPASPRSWQNARSRRKRKRRRRSMADGLIRRMTTYCFGAPPADNEEFIRHLVGKRITRLETRRWRENCRVYCLEVEDGTNAMLAGSQVEIREHAD